MLVRLAIAAYREHSKWLQQQWSAQQWSAWPGTGLSMQIVVTLEHTNGSGQNNFRGFKCNTLQHSTLAVQFVPKLALKHRLALAL